MIRSIEEHILTQEQAEACIKEWQQVLGLEHWIIQLEIKRAEDMSITNATGTMWQDIPHRTAVLGLMNPIDYINIPVVPQDMEQTIVHELLHIVMAPLKVKEKRNIELEIAINTLASALVTSKRIALTEE